MANNIGFRLDNKDRKREKALKPEVTLEYEESEAAKRRLQAAFEMLFPDGVQPINDQEGPVEPKQGTQLPLF